MRGSSKTSRQRAGDSLFIPISSSNTKENGQEIYLMERALRYGRKMGTKFTMKESSSKASSMERESMLMTTLPTRASSRTMS